MATTAPIKPQHWVTRHKVWTTLLALIVIACAVGFTFCGPW